MKEKINALIESKMLELTLLMIIAAIYFLLGRE